MFKQIVLYNGYYYVRRLTLLGWQYLGYKHDQNNIDHYYWWNSINGRFLYRYKSLIAARTLYSNYLESNTNTIIVMENLS